MGMYEPIKRMISTNDNHSTKLLAGAIAGFLVSGFVNPTDLLKIRM